MEETIDRIIFFCLGGGFGWILHVIVSTIRETKEEVTEVLKIERKRGEAGILQHRVAFNVAFSLMIVFVFYAAFNSYQVGNDLQDEQQEDFVSLCRSAEEIRDVQRNIVDAVYALAIGVVQREANDPPRTKDELTLANQFIAHTNEFRRQAYADIRPTDACIDYVNDDDVEPPTPDQPFLE